MIAICNGVDLSDLVGYGYEYQRTPQYGGQVTAIDGTDYSAKLRDIVHLKVPFIALTLPQLESVLQLIQNSDAYVEWTYYDPWIPGERTIQMKVDQRTTRLKVHYMNGTEYWEGLVFELTER